MGRQQTDPARLKGEALYRWYVRPSRDIEQERQSVSDGQRRAYFTQTNATRRDLPSQAANDQQGSRAGLGDIRAQTPIDFATDALKDFQDGPKIPRPNLAESFIPVVGPAWEAAGDHLDGNYGGAAFNAAMAVGDALPVGAIFKGVKAARKGIGVLKDGAVTAGAAAAAIKKAGLAGADKEIHHTIALEGLGRSVPDWRNHFALLKVLKKETHRRLRGSWKGKPKFGPVMRVWHGTTDWQKTVPVAIGAYTADAWENLNRPFAAQTDPRK